MCTAHNHSKYCKCGFGEGNNNFSYSNYSKIFKTNFSEEVINKFPINSFSFTNPNAKCPVCLANVFFYQNHYGSRVFFDELGPPWTKHPCTDNSQYSYNKKYDNINLYSKEKNFIPLESDKINSQIKSNGIWKLFETNIFSQIYENIYEYKSQEFYVLGRIPIFDDFIFYQEIDKDNILISSYNVFQDRITEILLKSRTFCLNTHYENNFRVIENDIFYVKFISDKLFSTKVITVNRLPQTFEMRINQFSEKTRRKILFNGGKGVNKIKVQLRDNIPFEI
ncbi:hypothetical protein [Chryseobacterium sp. T1]